MAEHEYQPRGARVVVKIEDRYGFRITEAQANEHNEEAPAFDAEYEDLEDADDTMETPKPEYTPLGRSTQAEAIEAIEAIYEPPPENTQRELIFDSNPTDEKHFTPYAKGRIADDGTKVVSSTGAVKNDGGKLRWDLLPARALEEIVEIFTIGAEKYGDRNWQKGMPWSRPYAALMRHMWAWWRGEDLDPETGKSHLAHAGCNLLFLLEYRRIHLEGDDR